MDHTGGRVLTLCASDSDAEEVKIIMCAGQSVPLGRKWKGKETYD
jgi:hypothetical protein